MSFPHIALHRAIESLFVRGPRAPAEEAAAPRDCRRAKNVEMVELAARLYATIDAQDWTRPPDLVSPDLEVRLGVGAPVDLRQWRSRLATFFVAFPDGQHLIDEIVADGDRVVSRCRFVGTHTGTFHGAAPTGRRVEMAVVHVDRFEDGLLQSHFGLHEGVLPH